MFENELKEMGLTDNEVRIYLLLLKNEKLNPSEISKKLGFHRSYVYDALEKMLEKEIVNEIIVESKKYFQATNPENLIEIIRYKMENLQAIIPRLSKIRHDAQEETKVELFSGKRVYRTLLKDITSSIKENEEVCLIGINEKLLLDEIEPLYLRQYFTILKKNKIKERIIIKKESKKVKGENLKYKEIDEAYIGDSVLAYYGQKTAIFIPGAPYYLIIIKNKRFTENNIKLFEFLWKMAR